jgi:hypothetical protein
MLRGGGWATPLEQEQQYILNLNIAPTAQNERNTERH